MQAGSRRLVRRAVATLGLAGFLVVTPSFPGVGAPAPHPVAPRVHRIEMLAQPVSAAIAEGAPAVVAGQRQPAGAVRAAAATPVQPVEARVAVVGATWAGTPAASGDGVEIRVRTGDAWGPWLPLDGEPSESADPREAGTDAPAGTSARVVVGATAIQARWLGRSGRLPQGLALHVVDPGRSDADAAVAGPRPGVAVGDAVRPTIRSRADWGADESLITSPPEYAQAHLVFVHHTAGANDYAPADVPAILRGILAFHVTGRGWRDIGYNALVDKFGTIWEGRTGGLDQAVIGAHTLGHNSWSFGVSVLGDHTSTPPTASSLEALARYIAWKFSLHGDPVYGQVYASDGWFNRVSGHRDGQETSCPGQLLYDQLPALRARVAALVGRLSVTPLVRSVDAGGSTDVLVYPVDAQGAQTGRGVIALGAGPTPTSGSSVVGVGWTSTMTDVSLSPDLTGDGRPDLLAVERRSGALRIYAGNGAAGVSQVLAVPGYGGYDLVLPAGDRDRDGSADLVARTSTGDLMLLRGNGRGAFAAPQRIGIGWGGMRILTPGDLTGDGIEDLYLITVGGDLLLYPGAVGGGLTGARSVRGVGWQSLSLVVAARDLDGDRAPGDLLGRDTSGRMRTYYANGSDGFGRTNTWGSGWGGIGQLAVGDWTGDGKADLLGTRPSDGALLLYPGTGLRDFMQTVPGPSVAGADLVLLVGDVDGDGLGDAVARVTNGDLHGLWGRPGGGFSAPFKIGNGWGAGEISAIGDYTRDGVPDLVLHLPASGRTISYPMTRSFGFRTPMPFDSGWTDLVSITVGGVVNADANLDLVALDRAGTIWLQPGSGPSSTLDRISLLTGQTDLVQLLGVGDISGDGLPDLVARTNAGPVVLYPGTADATFAGRVPLRGPWTASTRLG